MIVPWEYQSLSVESTLALGVRLGTCAKPNDVVALVGELGAGKTQLAKGIAMGAGVGNERAVNSPTYVIINEYIGRLRIYHVDAYRLSGSLELAALGFDAMCQASGLVVIEWSDKVRDLLPEDHLEITIQSPSMHERTFSLTAHGTSARELLNCVKERKP